MIPAVMNVEARLELAVLRTAPGTFAEVLMTRADIESRDIILMLIPWEDTGRCVDHRTRVTRG